MALVGTPVSTSYTLVPTYGFTSEKLVQALYGGYGYSYISDDVSSGDWQTIVTQFINDAEQLIVFYLGRYHSPEDLANSFYVKSRATWIAAYYISQRRGNEHYFRELHDRAIRELEAIATGELPPLADIPLRSNTTPSMSNHTIDDRFMISKVRVLPTISVGDSYPGQPIAYNIVENAP